MIKILEKDLAEIFALADNSSNEQSIIVNKQDLVTITSEFLYIMSIIAYGSKLFAAYENDEMPLEIKDFLQSCYANFHRYKD